MHAIDPISYEDPAVQYGKRFGVTVQHPFPNVCCLNILGNLIKA